MGIRLETLNVLLPVAALVALSLVEGQILLLIVEAAELEVKQSQAMPIGTLRLDLSFTFGKLHIAPALLKFAADYPDLKLNVSFNDRLIDLVEEGINATVRVGLNTDSRLIMHHLATARYITCAAPQYLARYGTPTVPTELLQHRCVNFVFPQTRQAPTWKFEQEGRLIDLIVDSYLQFDNSEVILEAVIAGAGVVQLPKFIAANAIAQGNLGLSRDTCNLVPLRWKHLPHPHFTRDTFFGLMSAN